MRIEATKFPPLIKKGSLAGNIAVFSFLVILCFAGYFETISLGFFSDDFQVIYRLTVDKVFWAPGFFRPLSDITLLGNFHLNGYNPAAYRCTNILMHATTCFILYLVVINLLKKVRMQGRWVGLMAAMLFAIYPMHNESVIWIVGRASLIGNLFGLLALYVYFGEMKSYWKILLSCCFFFTGLTSYESIIILPGIIFLYELYRSGINAAIRRLIPFIITLAGYLVIRWIVAGVFAGSYGEGMFGEGQRNYLVKFFKSFGRLFIPGTHNSTLLVVLFTLIVILLIVVTYLVYKYRNKYFRFYLLLWGFVFTAQVVPAMFGVNTHTSESGRLLYFPAAFLVVTIAFLVSLLPSFKWKTASIVVISIIFFMLLKRDNKNWVRADTIIDTILDSVGAACCEGNIYIANLPVATKGSYVFGNGFYEAALLRGYKDVQVISYLVNTHERGEVVNLPPQKTFANSYIIPPLVAIRDSVIVSDSIAQGKTYVRNFKLTEGDVILYWNKNKMVSLLP